MPWGMRRSTRPSPRSLAVVDAERPSAARPSPMHGPGSPRPGDPASLPWPPRAAHPCCVQARIAFAASLAASDRLATLAARVTVSRGKPRSRAALRPPFAGLPPWGFGATCTKTSPFFRSALSATHQAISSDRSISDISRLRKFIVRPKLRCRPWHHFFQNLCDFKKISLIGVLRVADGATKVLHNAH